MTYEIADKEKRLPNVAYIQGIGMDTHFIKDNVDLGYLDKFLHASSAEAKRAGGEPFIKYKINPTNGQLYGELTPKGVDWYNSHIAPELSSIVRGQNFEHMSKLEEIGNSGVNHPLEVMKDNPDQV